MKTQLKCQMHSFYKAFCFSIMCSCSLMAVNATSGINIRHLVNEQHIITVTDAEKYVLLPIQDNAPEAKIYLVTENRKASEAITVRLAREQVDYWVPLDISQYRDNHLSIDVQGVPANAICWKELKTSDTFDTSNREAFRPLYHHTPVYGWMNDPNGMFYKDGTWHLYYQYNPYGSSWGNMTWGHSTSRDLVNWTHHPAAITADAWGAIFSGSCVVDHDNTAGFGAGAVIAFYTSAKSSPWGDCQSQSIAYSLDNGQTFTKYEGNPVLTSMERDFRDPKVFWYAPGKHWVMMLAVGQEMQIYSSINLKDWKKESSFGNKQGAHGGVWECPDLVELPIEGTNEKRWVLICNINPGGPFGGSATQYFVGNFNGKKFTNESPTETKWMDWGKDNYATVTFSNVPDGRTVAIGWMSNWQYQGVLPTMQYRGSNTIARELTLYRKNGELLLKSAPVKEMESARLEKKTIPTFRVKEGYKIDKLLEGNNGAYELEMTIKNNGAQRIALTLSNGKDEQLHMHIDVQRKQFVMERSESGLTDFSRDFPALTVAPMSNVEDINLRIFVDRSSIEVFGENGKYVMTNRVFPSEPYNTLTFDNVRGNYQVKSLNIYKLK